MAEYIEREKAIEHIETHLPYRCSEDFVMGQQDCIEQLKSLPTADVVEVVHASWVWGKVCGSKGYCCTNCGAGFVGENAEWIAKEHDYCPKCGAKMDGDEK